MRMRFKQRLSALLAQVGFTPPPPPPRVAACSAGRTRLRIPTRTRKRKRTHARTRSLYARLHPAPVRHMRHLWPPQEGSRRPEWSSAVPGEWSTRRGESSEKADDIPRSR